MTGNSCPAVSGEDFLHVTYMILHMILLKTNRVLIRRVMYILYPPTFFYCLPDTTLFALVLHTASTLHATAWRVCLELGSQERIE